MEDRRGLEARRRSDGHNEPQMQVVGFHVEGQSPSPAGASILADSLRTISSGSPTPVIIPPQFQSQTSIGRQDSAANRSLAPEFAAGQAGHNVLRPAADPNRQTAAGGGAAAPQAAAAAGAAPTAAQPAPAASSSSSSSTAAQQHPNGSGQQPAPSGTKSSSSSATTTADPAPPAAVASSSSRAAPDPAGSVSAGAGAAVAGDEQQPPPPKAPKPTSKAERRALQEAQRAAKAAAKGGGSGGAGGSGSKAASGADGAAGGSAKPPRAPSAAGGQAGGGQGSGAAGGSSRAAGSTGDSGRASGAGGQGSGPRGGAAGSSGGSSSVASPAGAGAAAGKARGPLNLLNSTELFAHLQQYRPVSVEGVMRSKEGSSVHPAVLALGLRYADGSIKGSTARCVAIVHALCQVIADYHTPEGKSLPRDLMATINASVDFLVRCRPLSVSMGNAIKALKLCISKIDPNAPEEAAKSSLVSMMADWLQEKVALADKVLVEHAVTKVYDGDVILTYAYSQVVLEVLLTAARQGKRFRVLVVDSRPELEGRQMLRRLLQADIACSYVFLSGLSYVMREASKVMLGAAAVLSNGTVFSRAGSAAVAMCAAASSKPVLVCCEAFKFHERVQLDSITHNELGDPAVLAYLPPYAPAEALVPGQPDPARGALSAGLANWQDSPRLALLNLKYDAMPAEYVTMVVTEFGMIPPSSVPVILREFSESAQLD